MQASSAFLSLPYTAAAMCCGQGLYSQNKFWSKGTPLCVGKLKLAVVASHSSSSVQKPYISAVQHWPYQGTALAAGCQEKP